MKGIVWRPDTCSCQIVYEYDETLPDSEKTFTGKRVDKVCDVHKETTDPDELYKKVLAENKKKNITLDKLYNTYGLTDSDFSWEFDKERKIKVTLFVSNKEVEDYLATL